MKLDISLEKPLDFCLLNIPDDYLWGSRKSTALQNLLETCLLIPTSVFLVFNAFPVLFESISEEHIQGQLEET